MAAAVLDWEVASMVTVSGGGDGLGGGGEEVGLRDEVVPNLDDAVISQLQR